MNRFLKLSFLVFISVATLTGCLGKTVHYKPENLELIPKETALQHINKYMKNGWEFFCAPGYGKTFPPKNEIFTESGIHPFQDGYQHIGKKPYSQWSASIRHWRGNTNQIFLIYPAHSNGFTMKSHLLLCHQDNATLEKTYKALLSLGVQYSEF